MTRSRAVVLSIHPQYAEAILLGAKTWEYRRRPWIEPSISRVLLYATAPVHRVIGEFQPGRILRAELRETLWLLTAIGGGVTWKVFAEYFTGGSSASAVEVLRPRRYHPAKHLRSICDWPRPPQSWRYFYGTME